MDNKKLSNRALVILDCIARRSENGMSWLPGNARGMDDYEPVSSTYLNINGAGDARILASLMERRLIGQRRTDNGRYDWLYATEEGLLLLAENHERLASVLDGLRRDRLMRESNHG